MLRSMELNFPPLDRKKTQKASAEREAKDWTPPLLVGFGPAHSAPDGTLMLVKLCGIGQCQQRPMVNGSPSHWF